MTYLKTLQEIKQIYLDLIPYYVNQNTFSKASEKEIESFEVKLNVKLPDYFRNFLLTNDLAINFQSNFQMLSLKQLFENWDRMSQLLDKGVFDDGRVEKHLEEGFGNWDSGCIQQVWWDKKWIPFAEDSAGNMYCIDLNPTPQGKIGQLLNMEIQEGQGIFLMPEYENFVHFLENYLNELNKKNYTLQEYHEFQNKMQYYIEIN